MVSIILKKHFIVTRPILVFLRNSFGCIFCSDDELDMQELVIKHINEQHWSVQILTSSSNATIGTYEGVVLHQGYIIFLPSDLYDARKELVYQLVMLNDKTLLNPRGKFIIIIPKISSTSGEIFSREILQLLWSLNKICNVVILVAEDSVDTPYNVGTPHAIGNKILSLYYGSIYEDEECGKSVTVRKLMENNSNLLSNLEEIDFFPRKIPKDFKGCLLPVSFVGYPPYIFLEKNMKTNSTEVGGISAELINYFTNHFNFTTHFIVPTMGITSESYDLLYKQLLEGISDIGAGMLYYSFLPRQIVDISIPFSTDVIQFVVPCSNKISRTQRVLSIFTIWVWLTLFIFLIIFSILFWIAANGPIEDYPFQTIYLSFYNSWAILLGVSVTEKPKKPSLRRFFILYVCYSFAISTIFQAYFTTYLVEPGYGKEFSTFDDLSNAGVEFGDISSLDLYPKYKEVYRTFYRIRKSKIDCGDFINCFFRVVDRQNIFVTSPSRLSKFIASDRGYITLNHLICFLSEGDHHDSFAFVFRKGHPLLETINDILEKYIEAGFVDRYYERAYYNTTLENKLATDEEMYFVFSLSDLLPVFVVLGFGLFGCCIVFLFEIVMKFSYFNKKRRSIC
ncbi:hypothetical protein L9F63_017235 [Diploptera punctata]|uniref:Uncharacterized protein n=1 Tax=Diploptera punctata TaxID=6984 RepID=A0AAD8A0G6_DIPPU|nr:hypothetical protein L9F63_017235 [Diploptera punctata]